MLIKKKKKEQSGKNMLKKTQINSSAPERSRTFFNSQDKIRKKKVKPLGKHHTQHG